MKAMQIQNRNSNRQRADYYKRQIKLKFATKKAEIIAWLVFFGIGVSYFIATMIIAIV